MTSRLRQAARPAGFTLLELMIALAIVGTLLAIAFGGLRMGIVAWTRGEDRAELQQHARGITQIVGRTVGAAYPFFGAYGEAPERRMLFRGEEDKLEFVTQAPAFPTGVTTAFTAIVLALEDTGQGRSLVIRQRILPNREPFSEAAVVLRDSTIQGLELRYLVSEGTWSERWDGDAEKRLPAAITIRFSVMRAGKLEPAPPMTVSLRTVAAQ